MKVIFLDFDGVIRIPVPGDAGRPEAEFCGVRMKRVARLAKDADARIVISSDWRRQENLESITALLSPHIGAEWLHADWKTPQFGVDLSVGEEEPPPRGAEIVAWLSKHPETEDFVILDDMPARFFPLMQSRLVSSQLMDGFTEDHLRTALRILGC